MRNFVRCPHCYARVRLEDGLEGDAALDLHRFSGRCRAVDAPPIRDSRGGRTVRVVDDKR